MNKIIYKINNFKIQKVIKAKTRNKKINKRNIRKIGLNLKLY